MNPNKTTNDDDDVCSSFAIQLVATAAAAAAEEERPRQTRRQHSCDASAPTTDERLLPDDETQSPAVPVLSLPCAATDRWRVPYSSSAGVDGRRVTGRAGARAVTAGRLPSEPRATAAGRPSGFVDIYSPWRLLRPGDRRRRRASHGG